MRYLFGYGNIVNVVECPIHETRLVASSLYPVASSRADGLFEIQSGNVFNFDRLISEWARIGLKVN
jgi:hypothetical protein